ncbi:xaa-Pro aminopeptidase ApepP-like [Zerene cesonia]|uniref:xaa-Pro aminopeptidase ApepP-like n=1 Tax=Zerene cesonia TaxID=33412 RepID=UPI0018E52629|nr:xaa-Pro aminopeptidase ApepP-like [Zerene cesonia]
MADVRRVCLFYLIVLVHSAISYVPRSDYQWAEPDSNAPSNPLSKLGRQLSLQRVQALRRVMQDYGVQAFIVPTADAHNSQYIAPTDARREWISGLSGSSGTALVTSTAALVWTDGRYFTQFYLQVDTSVWGLMRQGTDLSIQAWLTQNMPSGSVVGVDPTTYTRTAWTPLYNALRAVNVTLMSIDENLVDLARTSIHDPPPPRPNEPLLALGVEYTGRISSSKITELRAQMRSRGASALILTALDDVALNNVILFWGNGALAANVREHLSAENTQIVIKPYGDVFDYIRNMTHALPPDSSIWLSTDASHAVYSTVETNDLINIISSVSPVALMKCVKNHVELAGFRSAHIKDGIAVVRFLRWVHERVDAGDIVTEINVVDKLNDLRGEEFGYKGPSFATIAGAGENGAIIHYKPSREGTQRVIRKEDMLLVDSGGQYLDGTTDITRTRHMSTPSEMQKLTFTRVLKGQILLGTAVFPKGSTGNLLETLARKALWDVGLNYAHGTGHGVGHFLNVHEGPSGIGAALMVNDPGIVPGMIFSDEPGFYEVGEYGIRHEDIVEVIEMSPEVDHIFAKGLVGNFSGQGAVGFYTISLAPHQAACIDVELLSDDELKYLNSYHARVLATLGPILLNRNLTEDYAWLEKECAPIHRSAAMLVKSAPLLIIAFSLITRL